MAVEEAGEQDSEGLAQCHNDGEDGGAELCDGIEDEELATSGAEREQSSVSCKLAVAAHERQRVEQSTCLQQRAHRQEAGEQVHAEHHLHRGHLVAEKLVLPVGGEAVEHDVAGQDDDAGESSDGCVLGTARARQKEHAHTH